MPILSGKCKNLIDSAEYRHFLCFSKRVSEVIIAWNSTEKERISFYSDPKIPKSVHNSKFCWDMDTFECYCRNNLAMTTINKAAASVLRQAQQPCDSLTATRLGCRAVVPRQPHYSFARCKCWYSGLMNCRFGRTGFFWVEEKEANLSQICLKYRFLWRIMVFLRRETRKGNMAQTPKTIVS